MKITKILGGILAVFAADGALGAQAADDSGWYLGFGAGRSDVRAALDDAARSDDPILSKAARAALKILEKR